MTDVEADLTEIEGEAGVSLVTSVLMAPPDYPTDVVGSREAGYSIGSWLGIEGIAVAMEPAARTSLSVNGGDLAPIFSIWDEQLSSITLGRWRPETFNTDTGSWIGSAGTTMVFGPEAGIPMYINPADDPNRQTYKHRVKGVRAPAVEFDESEVLIAPLPRIAAVGVAVVCTIGRHSDDEDFGIMELESVTSEQAQNPYIGARYTTEDYIEVWHNGAVLASVRKYTDDETVNVLGVYTDVATGLVHLTLINEFQDDSRQALAEQGYPTMPLGGQVVLGRSSGPQPGLAPMKLMDMCFTPDIDTFQTALRTYASYYISGNATTGQER